MQSLNKTNIDFGIKSEKVTKSKMSNHELHHHSKIITPKKKKALDLRYSHLAKPQLDTFISNN